MSGIIAKILLVSMSAALCPLTLAGAGPEDAYVKAYAERARKGRPESDGPDCFRYDGHLKLTVEGLARYDAQSVEDYVYCMKKAAVRSGCTPVSSPDLLRAKTYALYERERTITQTGRAELARIRDAQDAFEHCHDLGSARCQGDYDKLDLQSAAFLAADEGAIALWGECQRLAAQGTDCQPLSQDELRDARTRGAYSKTDGPAKANTERLEFLRVKQDRFVACLAKHKPKHRP